MTGGFYLHVLPYISIAKRWNLSYSFSIIYFICLQRESPNPKIAPTIHYNLMFTEQAIPMGHGHWQGNLLLFLKASSYILTNDVQIIEWANTHTHTWIALDHSFSKFIASHCCHQQKILCYSTIRSVLQFFFQSWVHWYTLDSYKKLSCYLLPGF